MICTTCKIDKDAEKFNKASARKSGRQTRCKTCCHEYYVGGYRQITILKVYNLTPEQWETLFQSQDRCCLICKRGEDIVDRWCVDHNHLCCPGRISCGKCVRGILCLPCNRAIGLLGDDVQRVSNAVEYLKKYLVQ